MTSEDILWKHFETTGSIDSYLAYKRIGQKSDSKEETVFGDSGNRGNSDQRGQIR